MEFRVRTRSKEELVSITSEVAGAVRKIGGDGVAFIHVPHTTAGILVNEDADPDVARDILDALARIVPDSGYRHAEGNSPAHIKTTLVGSSVLLPVSGGRLERGRWQGVFLAEFDGPRTRTVKVRVV